MDQISSKGGFAKARQAYQTVQGTFERTPIARYRPGRFFLLLKHRITCSRQAFLHYLWMLHHIQHLSISPHYANQ